MSKTKYFEIMEYADNSVGANFYYVEESEIERTTESLSGNYEIEEISSEQYIQEQKRIYRKNYYLMTGRHLTEEELDNSF